MKHPDVCFSTSEWARKASSYNSCIIQLMFDILWLLVAGRVSGKSYGLERLAELLLDVVSDSGLSIVSSNCGSSIG